jgi:acyl carrier protein
MRDEIIRILEDIDPSVVYDRCTTLVTDRYISSLSMVALIPELEDAFDVEIPAVEVVVQNFDSVDAMVALVTRLRDNVL